MMEHPDQQQPQEFQHNQQWWPPVGENNPQMMHGGPQRPRGHHQGQSRSPSPVGQNFRMPVPAGSAGSTGGGGIPPWARGLGVNPTAHSPLGNGNKPPPGVGGSPDVRSRQNSSPFGNGSPFPPRPDQSPKSNPPGMPMFPLHPVDSDSLIPEGNPIMNIPPGLIDGPPGGGPPTGASSGPNGPPGPRPPSSSKSSRSSSSSSNANKKRYHCEICQKRFSTAWYVRVHRKSHNGERPYVCRNCGKGFMLPNVLQVHMRKCEKTNAVGVPTSISGGPGGQPPHHIGGPHGPPPHHPMHPFGLPGGPPVPPPPPHMMPPDHPDTFHPMYGPIPPGVHHPGGPRPSGPPLDIPPMFSLAGGPPNPPFNDRFWPGPPGPSVLQQPQSGGGEPTQVPQGQPSSEPSNNSEGGGPSSFGGESNDGESSGNNDNGSSGNAKRGGEDNRNNEKEEGQQQNANLNPDQHLRPPHQQPRIPPTSSSKPEGEMSFPSSDPFLGIDKPQDKGGGGSSDDHGRVTQSQGGHSGALSEHSRVTPSQGGHSVLEDHSRVTPSPSSTASTSSPKNVLDTKQGNSSNLSHVRIHNRFPTKSGLGGNKAGIEN